MMLSAQALAFDVGGLSYDVINTTDVEVTGRASGNTDTDIVIPATASDGTTTYSVTAIGSEAFQCVYSGCLSGRGYPLTSVIIPDGVTTIGDYAFKGNALTSVTIPESVTTIGGLLFAENALTSPTFKGNFDDFDPDMFIDIPTLTTITYCEGTTGWPQGLEVESSDGISGITAT